MSSSFEQLSCLSVDVILQEEELRQRLLRVAYTLCTRQADFEAHIVVAHSILHTVEQLASRVEALGEHQPACEAPPTAQTSSTPSPARHEYGVELDAEHPCSADTDRAISQGRIALPSRLTRLQPTTATATGPPCSLPWQRRPASPFQTNAPPPAAAHDGRASFSLCMPRDTEEGTRRAVRPSTSNHSAHARPAPCEGGLPIETSTSAKGDLAAAASPCPVTPPASSQQQQQWGIRPRPTLACKGGGADHSPAHESNSTSPFYRGHGNNSEPASAQPNANAKENSFTVRQPTQSHSNEDVGNTEMVPPQPMLYPTNADVSGAQLTAYEEQGPRGSAGDIPCVVVLRHRMGFSTVVLSAHQRSSYNRYDLENFVLYKEQKYNAVNVLWRFSMLVLLILTFSVFCLAFSTCTTEWVRLEHTDNYLSLGLFVSCRDRSLRTCAARTSSRLEWHVTDAVTGGTLCTASASFVHRFIGAIWAMAILQLVCELIALVLTAWIVSRPTRSGALVVLFFDLVLGTMSGIVAVVLFHHYSACLRQTCVGEHLSGRFCNVSWRFGYKLYLGALAVHGVVLLLALCMHSYIHNIRVTARKQLRVERRRASRRHADAEEYMMHVLDDPLEEAEGPDYASEEDANERAVDDNSAATAAATTPQGRLGATRRETRRGGAGEQQGVEEEEEEKESPFLPPSLQTRQQQQQQQQQHLPSHGQGLDPLAHSAMHVSFVGVPGAGSTPASPARDPRQPHTSGQPSPVSELATASRVDKVFPGSGPGEEGGAVTDVSELVAQTRSERSPTTSSARQRRGDRHRHRHGDTSAYPTGSRHRPQHHPVHPSAAAKKRASADTSAYKQARKRSRFFVRFFNREYDANYLTAAELGVPIEGANDWVYDDRSDMYYSFERHMFWDPLTREYYNCALKTWQESPKNVVEVRDVLDFMLEDSEDSSAAEEEEEMEEDCEAGRVTSEEHVNAGGGSSRSSGKSAHQQQQQHQIHREPVTPATHTATAGADSSAVNGGALSVTSGRVHRIAETEEDEPAFDADHDGHTVLYSMNGSFNSA